MTMLATEQAAPYFPFRADMPESWLHLEVRTLLWQFLKLAFGQVATLGSEQFVYWDPTDPKACLAPDVFVRFGTQHRPFRSWKVWERGAPHVAVEIISESDAESWREKLAKYRRFGVSELVLFDPAAPDHPLRVWDLAADGLLERQLPERWARSVLLNGYWHAVEDPELGLTLRLSLDEHGVRLLPTPAERDAHGRRVAEERVRLVEERVRELEAELKRR